MVLTVDHQAWYWLYAGQVSGIFLDGDYTYCHVMALCATGDKSLPGPMMIENTTNVTSFQQKAIYWDEKKTQLRSVRHQLLISLCLINVDPRAFDIWISGLLSILCSHQSPNIIHLIILCTVAILHHPQCRIPFSIRFIMRCGHLWKFT